MADIRFEVQHRFDRPPKEVWDELVDWKRHEAWIPLTKMEVEPGDPTEVGREITARTGVGPLALVDRMRVASCRWDESASTGECVVDKLGPVLRGQAGFDLRPNGSATRLAWFEAVSVPYMPQFLAPIGATVGAFFFRQGMRRLDAVMRR